MHKYYYKDDKKLEGRIESLFKPESTVTNVVLKLRGISPVSLVGGDEYLSELDPFKELKDGIAYSQTERHKNECLGYQWLENHKNAMNVSTQYFIHRNGEGMIYIVEKKVQWVESNEKPEIVLSKCGDLILGK